MTYSRPTHALRCSGRLVAAMAIAVIVASGLCVSVKASQAQSAQPEKLKTLPPGHHALLEEMTRQFGLTYDQELEIEPRLHAEESVSKPLLRYTVLNDQQRKDMMLRIKIAARRDLLPLLTPEQRPLLQRDIDSLTSTGRDDLGSSRKGGKKGGGRKGAGKKGGGKKAKKPVEPLSPAELLADEETLSEAIKNYRPLTDAEKAAMLLEIKQAALADSELPITPADRSRLEAEVRQLSAQAPPSGVELRKRVSPLPISGVAHIAYYVPSLDDARPFYHNFLGFDEAFTGTDSSGVPVAYYKINDQQYIILYAAKPTNHGYIHDIAFRTDDIQQLSKELAARGAKVSPVAKNAAGNLYVQTTDNAGFEVRFVQYTPDSATGRERGKLMPARRVSSKIDHIGEMFQSREEAQRFYGDVLGFAPEGTGKITKMTIGNGPDRFELGFGRAATAERYHVKNHICLSVADVPAEVAALASHKGGEQFKSADQHVLSNGKHVAEFYDPWGNRVELMEPAQGEPEGTAKESGVTRSPEAH